MRKQTKKDSHRHGPAHVSRRATRKNARAKSRARTVQFLFLPFLLACVISGGAVLGYSAKRIRNTPPLDVQAIRNVPASTRIYDRNGRWIGEIQDEGSRVPIHSLSEVSPYVTKAFLAAEDKHFFTHPGINPFSIARAAMQDLIGKKIVSGASTITQQVVKNVYFPHQDRTIDRKIQEIVLALRLEQNMSKEEILTHYLNWIYFGKWGGSNIYGIDAASRAYFGIPPKRLNLAQAAFLAAMPNNPSLYNATSNLGQTIARQHYILKQMRENGLISDEEWRTARSFPIEASLRNGAGPSSDPSYLLAEIKHRTAEALKKTGRYSSEEEAMKELSRGGYQVYTTIDCRLQQAMQNIIENPSMYAADLSYRVRAKDGKWIAVDQAKEQSGAVMIDNRSGGILAIGAGRDYKSNQNNHTMLPRQPGSAMKPLAIFAPAIEKRLAFPGTVIDDVPTIWKDAADESYFPFNWDKKFHGLITLREAFKQSYNIPALKVYEKLTPAVGLQFVKKMGITTIEPEDYTLASGIGGMSRGLTVEEATSAYTTFPNQGVWHDSFLIEKIVDRNQRVIYSHPSRSERVFSPQTAYILTDMMKDVVREGTARLVGQHFPGKPIAGKTGTTNEDKDAWFIGYTPSVTLGIWVGYDIPYPLKNLESKRPQILWNAIMDTYYHQMPVQNEQFPPQPEGVVRVEISRFSGKKPTRLVREQGGVTSDLFIKGTEPQEYDDVLVQLKYEEIGGKKYLADPGSPPGLYKVGVFIKRQPYVLPNHDSHYLPLDAKMEIPKEHLPPHDTRLEDLLPYFPFATNE
jgi:1A family penicillin-binding protein